MLVIGLRKNQSRFVVLTNSHGAKAPVVAAFKLPPGTHQLTQLFKSVLAGSLELSEPPLTFRELKKGRTQPLHRGSPETVETEQVPRVSF